jgi:hypothetical protein
MDDRTLVLWTAAHEERRGAYLAAVSARKALAPFLAQFGDWLVWCGYRRASGNSRPKDLNSGAKRRLVLRIVARDGPRCLWCNAGDPLELHHLIPRSWGGPNEDWNRVLLCRPCHAQEKPFSPHSARRLISLGATVLIWRGVT